MSPPTAAFTASSSTTYPCNSAITRRSPVSPASIALLVALLVPGWGLRRKRLLPRPHGAPLYHHALMRLRSRVSQKKRFIQGLTAHFMDHEAIVYEDTPTTPAERYALLRNFTGVHVYLVSNDDDEVLLGYEQVKIPPQYGMFGGMHEPSKNQHVFGTLWDELQEELCATPKLSGFLDAVAFFNIVDGKPTETRPKPKSLIIALQVAAIHEDVLADINDELLRRFTHEPKPKLDFWEMQHVRLWPKGQKNTNTTSYYQKQQALLSRHVHANPDAPEWDRVFEPFRYSFE